MLRSLLFLALVTVSVKTYAQTNTPQESGVTLHTSTRLVVVDVVVTDSHKNPVRNLKASDFTLLENNVAQKIQHFDEHAGGAVNANQETAPPLTPGVFSNYSPTPPGAAVNVLLLDLLNTPTVDQMYVKDQIRKFLKNAKPGAPIAIFGLTTHLSLLQGFTADPEVLANALNKTNAAFSALLQTPVTGVPAQDMGDHAASFIANAIQGASTPSELAAAQRATQADAQASGNLGFLRARYTLDAIDQLARYLSGMPGRKNMIWFSGSFPIDITPTGGADQFHNSYESLEQEFRETTNLLTRAQVSVYPIDARGAVVSPVGDVSQSGGVYNSATGFAQAQLNFHERLVVENGTMLRMAEQTGGKAFLNNNDLAGAVTQAINTGSNFYTLAYTPSDPHWNGGYRKVEVKVQREQVSLAYRRGYYADDPDSPANYGRNTTAAQVAPDEASNPMRLAMMFGAPDASEIAVKVRVLPVDEKPAEKLAKGNTIPLGTRMKGPYRSYAIDFAANPRGVMFKQAPDGVYHSYLQFVTYVYDHNGRLLNSVQDVVRANLAPAVYARVMTVGVPFHQEISVPVKGDYFLRVGLRDLSGNRVAAVEVPVDSIKSLPPVASIQVDSPSTKSVN